MTSKKSLDKIGAFSFSHSSGMHPVRLEYIDIYTDSVYNRGTVKGTGNPKV